MSLVQTVDSLIEYPESDGKPMGETDLHRDWMVRILEILRYRYRQQRVYVASDLIVYYEEGDPTRSVVPDDFVVMDCDPGRRRTFKTWEEGIEGQARWLVIGTRVFIQSVNRANGRFVPAIPCCGSEVRETFRDPRSFPGRSASRRHS